MGAKLAKAFELPSVTAGGLALKMRLAIKSGFSAEKAKAVLDSDENVEKMNKALQEIGCNEQI